MKSGWQWERTTYNMLLNAEWLARLSSYPSLYIGFSGGLDSTVLLHILAHSNAYSSSWKLSAIHVNHGLSKYAEAWERHCKVLCDTLGISFHAIALTLQGRHNLEARARDARYEAFGKCLAADPQAALVLAHHADDHAETCLLNLLRGAGIDGLSGMPEVSTSRSYPLLRPFLSQSRAALTEYAMAHDLVWIEDESNTDTTFSRNYIRHTIMPLLQARWPKARENIQRTAQHCRQAQHNLYALACLDVDRDTLGQRELPNALLIALDPYRRINVLRTWFQIHTISQPSASVLHAIVEDVILGREDGQAQVQWAETRVRRYNGSLYLLTISENNVLSTVNWKCFPDPLVLENLHSILLAAASKTGVHISFGAYVEIRFRQGGETMVLNGQTKALKKLMQVWKIPVWERDRIPLLYVNHVLQAVIGFAVADQVTTGDNESRYMITRNSGSVSPLSV